MPNCLKDHETTASVAILLGSMVKVKLSNNHNVLKGQSVAIRLFSL